MGKIISIVNQKGGVGKTTMAHMIALGLKNRGHKVLCVDLDPQTSLTLIAGAFGDEPTIWEVLTGKVSPQNGIYKKGNVDIIPGSEELAGSDLGGKKDLIKQALKSIKNDYDVVIIDNPPTLSHITANSLIASDTLIIPCGADVFSIQGLYQLMQTFKDVKVFNNSLEVSGVVLTRFDNRANISKSLATELESKAQELGLYIYNASIREGVAIRRYQNEDTDPYTTEKKQAVVQDYNMLVDEIIKRERL